jgi:hypothetical protein
MMMMMMVVVVVEHLDGLAPYEGAAHFQCRWQGFQHHVMANQHVTAESNHNQRTGMTRNSYENPQDFDHGLHRVEAHSKI